jgi:hypothetical protein
MVTIAGAASNSPSRASALPGALRRTLALCILFLSSEVPATRS